MNGRLERQQILAKPTRPLLWLIVDESALRNPIGGHEVMKAQLEHLADLCRSRIAQIHIIPAASGAHAALEGAMTLMTCRDGSSVGYVESPHAGQVVEQTERVARMHETYDLVRSSAMPPEASNRLLRRITEEHRQP